MFLKLQMLVIEKNGHLKVDWPNQKNGEEKKEKRNLKKRKA